MVVELHYNTIQLSIRSPKYRSSILLRLSVIEEFNRWRHGVGTYLIIIISVYYLYKSASRTGNARKDEVGLQLVRVQSSALVCKMVPRGGSTGGSMMA